MAGKKSDKRTLNKLESFFPHYQPPVRLMRQMRTFPWYFGSKEMETEDYEDMKKNQPVETLEESKARLGLAEITKQPIDLTCIYRCRYCGTVFSARPGPCSCSMCKKAMVDWLNLEELLPRFAEVDRRRSEK